MHFCGPDQLHGYEERLTTDIYPADFGWTPDWTRSRTARLVSHHGLGYAGRACVRTNQIDFDDEVVSATRQKLFDLARSRDRRPFCLVASLTHPHDPYVVPTSLLGSLQREEIDLPRVGDLAGDPGGAEDPHAARLRHVIGLGLARPTQAQVRAARRAYYGAVSYVDDQVGVLLSTLHEARFADNTIVMLFADHGDMLGERGLWYKMSFFEGSVRVPLLVRRPGHRAGWVPGPVSHLDLAPTLLALAGVGEGEAPGAGTSLVAAMDGTGPGPAVVRGEYFAEGVHAPMVMVRRDSLKYIRCEGDPDQLFDLDADPLELVKQASDPRHAELTGASAPRRRRTGTCPA